MSYFCLTAGPYFGILLFLTEVNLNRFRVNAVFSVDHSWKTDRTGKLPATLYRIGHNGYSGGLDKLIQVIGLYIQHKTSTWFD